MSQQMPLRLISTTTIINYIIYSHRPPVVAGDRDQAIQDNLNNSGLPKLPDVDTSPLEEQISSTEIWQAIKELKPGKALAQMASPAFIKHS